jgi:hypothetical protein
LHATALIWEGLMAIHSEESGAPQMRVKGTSPIGQSDALAAYRPVIATNSRKRVAPKIVPAGSDGSEVDQELHDVGTYQAAVAPSTLPPYRGATSQAQIGAWCIQAAAGGEIEPGALLSSQSKKSAKKAGK